MITRVFSVGLLAGLFAGLLVSALQHFTTVPLIIAAEAYETVALVAPPRHGLAVFDVTADRAPLVRVHGEHQHGEGEDAGWAPQDGLERTFYTGVATIATAIGFAFLLIGGLLAAAQRIDERQGLTWAAAGFVVTGLAPALGLAPELPGMVAADLLERQVWWIGTAAATAVALWLLFKSDNVFLKVAAVVLLVLPHAIGAPHVHDAAASRVPAELAARFAATSLVVHAALWALTGLAVGYLWRRGDEARGA